MIKKKQRMGAESSKLTREGDDQDKDGAAGGMAMGGGHFDYMNIDELKQHENGILNLFEGEKNIAKYVSHNKRKQIEIVQRRGNKSPQGSS